jgi:hypothetical protein
MESESDDEIEHDCMMLSFFELGAIHHIVEGHVLGQIHKTNTYPNILKKIQYLMSKYPGFKKARLNWEDCDYDTDD